MLPETSTLQRHTGGLNKKHVEQYRPFYITRELKFDIDNHLWLRKHRGQSWAVTLWNCLLCLCCVSMTLPFDLGILAFLWRRCPRCSRPQSHKTLCWKCTQLLAYRRLNYPNTEPYIDVYDQ